MTQWGKAVQAKSKTGPDLAMASIAHVIGWHRVACLVAVGARLLDLLHHART